MNALQSSLPCPDTKLPAPLEIRSIAWLQQNEAQQMASPHRHTHVELLWIKAGSGTVVIDLDKHEIYPDSIYCISPGQIHHFNIRAPLEGVAISFTHEFIGLQEDTVDILYNSGLFHTCQHSPVIQVSREMRAVMDETLDQMTKEYENYFLLRSEILRGLLRVFLLYLTRQIDKPSGRSVENRNAELVNKFLMLLEKNYASWKMVSDYADELAVTPNYLNEIIKKISGFPASYHIQQRIVLEAKRQALYAVKSMKEVALNLGFDDMAHFSKYFKRVVGINFTDFKKDSANYFSL